MLLRVFRARLAILLQRTVRVMVPLYCFNRRFNRQAGKNMHEFLTILTAIAHCIICIHIGGIS